MTQRLDWLKVFGVCVAFAVWLVATDHGSELLASWTGGEPAERPAEILGVVKVGEGERLPEGLRVIVQPMPRSHPAVTDSLEFASKMLQVREAPVGADGRYSLKLSRGGAYSVSVVAPDRRPTWQQVGVVETTNVEMKLDVGGYAVVGTMRGRQEETLSGVRVSVMSHAGQLLDQRSTDDEGEFRFVLPGGEYIFGFEHPEYSSPLQRRLVLADERSSFYMTPSRPLVVQVEGELNGPTRLAVFDLEGRVAAGGMTDQYGKFHVPHLPHGKYQAWAGGRFASGLKTFVVDDSAAVESVSVNISRKAPTSEVQLHDGCEPEVRAYSPATRGRTLRHKLTADELLVTEERQLHMWLPPVAAHVVVQCGDDQLRVPQPRESTGRSLRNWRRKMEATGRVLDGAGAPLGAAHVTVALPALSDGDVPWTMTHVTDEQGQFRMEVPMGTEVELRVVHPRFGTMSRKFSQGEELAELVFRFAPTHFLKGKVVDAQGHPVGKSTVAFTSLTSGNLSVQTQENGKFRLGPLGEHQGYLVVFDEGRPLQKQPLVVSPEAGKEISVTVEPRSL